LLGFFCFGRGRMRTLGFVSSGARRGIAKSIQAVRPGGLHQAGAHPTLSRAQQKLGFFCFGRGRMRTLGFVSSGARRGIAKSIQAVRAVLFINPEL